MTRKLNHDGIQTYFNELLKTPDNRMLLWFGVPKNCSTSIKKMMNINIENSPWLTLAQKSRKIKTPSQFGYRIDIDRNLPKYDWYDKEIFFSFTFVRNPYNRFYSSFKMALALGQTTNTCLDTFTDHLFEKRYLRSHSYISTQSRFIPTKHDLNIDFVGRVEDFENDWLLLQEKINHNFVSSTIRVQTKEYEELIKKEGHYKPPKVMNSKSLKILQEFYRDDFVNFGYDIEDFGDFKIT